MRQIDAGMGLSELTAFTAETWGCSRGNASDVACAAHKDWLDAACGSEEINQKDLLFQQVGRLEPIALKVENSGPIFCRRGRDNGTKSNDDSGR